MGSDGQTIPEYELLEELSLAVEGADTFTEALQETLRRICEATAWEYGESWVPDARGVSLGPGRAWFATGDAAMAFHTESESFRFAPGEGLPGRVWRSKEPEWVDDVTAESEETFVRQELAADAGLHAAFGIPIVGDRKVVAVLVFYMTESRTKDSKLVSLVSTVAVFGRLFVHKKRAENIAEQRTEVETTLDESPVGIAVVTADREVTYLNDHAVTLLELDDETLREMGTRPSALGLVNREGRALSPPELPFGRVLETEQAVYDQWVGLPRDGDDVLWISVSAAPILADSGEVEQVVLTFQDVSERVDEMRDLESLSRRLEEFASVLSHDLRSPLAVAEGYLAMARSEHDSESLERVATAHGRIAELIDDVLELARAGRAVTDREQVFLSEVAERAWQFTGRETATLTVERGLGAVQADRSRLQELLENLFQNALAHGSADARPADEAGEGAAEPASDAGVMVWVRPTEAGFAVDDDGLGIPEDERDRVFEVGYSGDSGTGLGLAIVRNIAEAHGWTLDVGTSPAGGARIEVGTERSD